MARPAPQRGTRPAASSSIVMGRRRSPGDIPTCLVAFEHPAEKKVYSPTAGAAASAVARVEALENRELLSTVPWATGEVQGLVLVDAGADKDVGQLADGASIDPASVGSQLNLRAILTGGQVGSCAFSLDGAPVRLESDAPFTLAGNNGSDYLSWRPTPGAHTLTVQPFADANGTGAAGQVLTCHFTVAGSAAPGGTPTATPAALTDAGGSWATATGATSDPAAPLPVISLLGRSVIAGSGVHVNALQSQLKSGSAITAQYEWNFGDPTGEYNVLRGWNAAHAYDTPGTYTITLTVTNDAGKASSVSTQVQIQPDTRRTIYVDSKSGADSNNGLSPETAVRTVDRVQSLLRSGTRVLFHRDQTFDTFNWLDIHDANVYVGAYGTGAADPVLNVKGHNALFVTHDAVNTVVQHVTFDSPYAATGNTANKVPADAGLYIGGTNTVVRDCTFKNLDDAINTNQDPTGVLVLDNDAPLATGLRAYFFWGQGSDAVILHNHVANSTREHNIRLSGTTRVLVAYNDLTNLDRQRVDPQDYSKGTVQVQKGSYAYVADNTLHDGPLRAGPRGENTEPASTATDWVVFEGNHVSNYQIDVYPGTHHLMIRNNVLSNDNASAIAINPSDPEGRTIDDIQILNNTGINHGYTGQFLRTNGLCPAASLTLGNNLYAAPGLTGGGYGTAPVYVAQNDLIAFASIFNNVWPVPAKSIKYGQGGINWVWPTYTGQTGYKTPKEWAAYPQVSGDRFANIPIDSAYHPSSAALVGKPTGAVLEDLNGNLRPVGGPWAVGAVQG
jgi:PKD repeat protein